LRLHPLLVAPVYALVTACTSAAPTREAPDASARSAASYRHALPMGAAGALLGASVPNVAQIVKAALSAEAGSDAGPDGVIQVPPPTGTAAIDSANINAAIAALSPTGGLVQLQAGTYVVSSPSQPEDGSVQLNVNDSTLAGMGIGVTTIQLAPNSSDVTGIVRTATPELPGVLPANSHMTFRDFTIDGNKSNQSATARIIGFYSGITPDDVQTDLDITVIRVESMNNTGYGFDPHERTTRLLIEGCVSHDNGTDGFTLDAVYDSVVIGCTSYANARHGYNLVFGTNSVRLVGDEAYSNGQDGIVLQESTKNCVVEGNIVHDNMADGIFVNGVPNSPPNIDTTPGTNNAIVGNLVENSGMHGIHVQGESGVEIAANTIRDSSQAEGGASNQIYLDDVAGSGSTGTFYSTQNTVYANSMLVTTGVASLPKYGIYENSAGDDANMYVGNQSFGALTAQWLFQGPGSIKYAAHNGSTGAQPVEVAYAFDSPAAHGLTEWNFPPQSIVGAGGVLTSGTVYFASLTAQDTFTVGHVDLYLGAQGSTLASGGSVVGLYTFPTADAGTSATLASASADQSANWSDAGNAGALSTVALTTPTAVAAGQVVMVGILTVGTTPPAFGRAPNSTGNPANLGQTKTTPLNFSTYETTSQTALPSSVTLFTDTTESGTIPVWVGLSI